MSALAWFLPAFLFSLLLTPLARWLGFRVGVAASPRSRDSIPTTGGISVLAAAAAGAGVCALIGRSVSLPPGLTAGVLTAAAVGLLDDVRPLRPWQKLAGQFVAASAAVLSGLRPVVFGDPLWDGVMVVVWLVWVSNAFNVTDMMDGLAAGVGVVTLAGIAFWATVQGETGLMAVGLLGTGSLAGFLVYNAPPARIYMGDSGSLSMGVLLGSLTVLVADRGTGWTRLAVPPLLLGVVMFEALFLTVVRTARSVPVMQASPDHTATRLRLMGLSTRETVALLWIVQGLVVALGVVEGLPAGSHPFWLWATAIVAVSGGFFLATVDVDLAPEDVAARGRAWFTRSWSVHRLLWNTMASVSPSVAGRLLDVGCGRRPYRMLFGVRTKMMVAVDRDRARYAGAPADVWCDAGHLPFGDATFETVVSNQMLEHVAHPQAVVAEMARVLKSEGRLILTAPHIWGVHEIPHDYYRFTPYGLRHLAESVGLFVEEVRALAGFWVTVGARFSYYLERFGRGPFSLPIRLLNLPIQGVALLLDWVHKVEEDAWNHLLVARKPGGRSD